MPKGTNLRKAPEQLTQTVQKHINNKSARKFGYLSPIQHALKHRVRCAITGMLFIKNQFLSDGFNDFKNLKQISNRKLTGNTRRRISYAPKAYGN